MAIHGSNSYEFSFEQGSHQDAGFAEGLQIGGKAGEDEGHRLGQVQGSKVGSEVGFYKGFASAWHNILLKDSSEKHRKKLKVLSQLLGLIDGFPLQEPQDPSLQEKMEAMRAKYKQVSSLLGVVPEKSQELCF
ncbi:hypothetical protein CAPTEDRAFT_227301 [Capitella teleta]|uniref:Essential protein Yae1 N-terminal domain-containing protein n=1 Tax=Capitella teleta TaxID=283909 RepID=R7UMZ1_CAPTE|nr:hypothetical protein CAPTEDRAFT_227301 [Capitella teleta]|eukprot:ELU05312.1 hypothetical protein CAPTEDRAFT_227301 [Capitella teleta]